MSSLIIPSPFGPLTITSDGTAITDVDFGNHAKTMAKNDKVLLKCRKELQEYFDGKRSTFSVAIKPEGTVFQKRIWKEMSRIPYGETISYKELSKRAGKPKAIRAAANACGKNPIVILIPCHRIIATGTAARMAALGGYSGGIAKKRWLLKHENKDRH